jgi:hypothetical protein
MAGGSGSPRLYQNADFFIRRLLLCHKKRGYVQLFLFDTQSIAHDVLQITVQLKILSLARDFCRVLTKISRKPQKSFLAVEMVK